MMPDSPILLKKGAWLALPKIVECLRRHELALEDSYFDMARSAWAPLNSHPEIKKQLLPIPKSMLLGGDAPRKPAIRLPRRATQ